MNELTANYLSRAETWLIITTLAYFFQNGAQVFETANVIPKFTAAPPESLQVFKGRYGLDFKAFWITTHTLHEITFILAIIFCWKIESIRNWLLILFTIHMAVRIWTIVYFAPTIQEFQRLANTQSPGTDLPNRARRWRLLNYIRVAIFLAVSLALLPLCAELINMRRG